jgi:hypothetical protein
MQMYNNHVYTLLQEGLFVALEDSFKRKPIGSIFCVLEQQILRSIQPETLTDYKRMDGYTILKRFCTNSG